MLYNIEATRILKPGQGYLGFILLLLASGIIISASLRYRMEALTFFLLPWISHYFHK